MFTLYHHPFCPQSRFVRLVLGEYGLDLQLVEERTWERREAFLALNPAGTTPVLIAEGQAPIPGPAILAEYLDETHGAALGGRRLLPTSVGERIEVRRLMAWFNDKFFEEASNPLVTERIYKRFMDEQDGGGAGGDVIRAAKANVRYHLAYIGWLAKTRNYLAGDNLTMRTSPPRPSFGDRLSGRRAMDRGRRGKGVVRAGEIPALVPSTAQRMAGRRTGVADLCGSRLLNRLFYLIHSPGLNAAISAMTVRSLSHGERVGVRGYGRSGDLIPSPELLRNSTSPDGRGEVAILR